MARISLSGHVGALASFRELQALKECWQISYLGTHVLEYLKDFYIPFLVNIFLDSVTKEGIY